ncbi:ATP-binding protein [Pseudenhygromyxa sp. WMMC2535]|uniref:ATP-binding protein n=1 Tax=Pseudenhygromyxa sp. WMMC2535 TaxID=2712867 RepID=UPI001553796D|nr:ATP-binding protein [Pseudenhygromyxa sp. WMMC2535]NVB36424.1 ATP-binding protein [Pseudenhygromyxa sp. WMMC2535]
MNTAIHNAASAEQHPIFDRLVELVELRARRRLVWLDAQRDQGWAEDEPGLEARFYAEQTSLAEINARIVELEDALIDGELGRPLTTLAAIFELDRGELDLLIGCLAPQLEPRITALYGSLQGRREHGYPTEPLIARLFGWGRRRLWHAGGGLSSWALLRADEVGLAQPPALTIDPQVMAFLQGRYGLDAALTSCARLLTPRSPVSSWPMDEVLDHIRRAVDARQPLRVVVVGEQGSGRRSFAAAIAERLELGALTVDCDDVDDRDWPEIHLLATRLARLVGLAPVWHGERVDRRWPWVVGSLPLQFVVCEDPRSLASQAGVVDLQLNLPSLGIDERRALWAALVPGALTWPQAEREHLVLRHRLNVGDIADVGRRLPADVEEAQTLAREQTRGRLGELGRLLDCPFGWDDLVVETKLRAALEDFAFEAKERAEFWETSAARRLFPRGTGLVALLTGPPGTGKTMAAQVISADLELDLFRVDLAAVVSKYIGETAKNLDKIFTRAGRMNAVLLFDEADALFSRRTEVKDSHDRHANADTNYLLQLLEDYRGIALLASNKRNNIDPAFIRRIRYVLDFQRPDAVARRRIWRQVLRELISADELRALEPTIARLSESVELSGAQIKNAVLAAIFVARRRRSGVGIDQLIRGIDRELGKEGRNINDRAKGRLRRERAPISQGRTP